MLARSGQAAANTEVQLPFGRNVQVEGGKDQVVLLAEREKVADGAGFGVVLESRSEHLGHIEGHLQARLETRAAMRVRTAKGFQEVRVHSNIPLAEFLFDDGPNLGRNRVRLELVSNETNLVGDPERDQQSPTL